MLDMSAYKMSDEISFDFLLDAFGDEIDTVLPDDLDTHACDLSDPINGQPVKAWSTMLSTMSAQSPAPPAIRIKNESQPQEQTLVSPISVDSCALEGACPKKLRTNESRPCAKQFGLNDLNTWEMSQMQKPQASQLHSLPKRTDIKEVLQIDLDALLAATPLIGSQRPARASHFSTTSTQSIASHHQSRASALTNYDVKSETHVTANVFTNGLQAGLNLNNQHALNLDRRSATAAANRIDMAAHLATPDAWSEQRVSQRPPKRARSQISSSGGMPQAALMCQQNLWSQWTNMGEQSLSLSSGAVREVDHTCSYCSRVKPHPEMETVRMQCECGGKFQDNTLRSHTCWVPSTDFDLSAMLTDVNDSLQQHCRPKFTWIDHKVKPPRAHPSTTIEYKFTPLSRSLALRISGKPPTKRRSRSQGPLPAST